MITDTCTELIKAIVNGEITADNAEAKTQDFYNQINTSIVK